MRLLILSFLLFSVQLGMGQRDAEISWKEELEFVFNAEYNEIAGIFDNQLLVIQSSNTQPQASINVSLDIYDKESLTLKNSMVLVDSKSDFNFEKLVITDKYVHLFTSFYDRQLGFKILAVQTLDESKGAFGESMRIDEVFSSEKSDDRSFNLATSPDGKNILIYHDNPSATGNKNFNLKVLSEDFTTVWEKEIELNYKDRMVQLEDLLIDDNSTVHLLSTINPYGINKSSGFGAILKMKNTLFTYHPYEDRLKEFEFALTRNWINHVKMVLDDNQNLLATAYYTYPNDYKMRGFVLIRLHHETGAMMMRKLVELNKDEYKKIDEAIFHLKEESRSLVGNAGIYPGTSSHMNNTSTEFSLKEVFVNDKGIVYAVEALRKDERCTESFNEQQMIVNCEKHFLYGDILLFFMSVEGTLVEVRNIHKMQHSVDRVNPYYSFSITKNGDDLMLMYNDEISNTLEKDELTVLSKRTLNNMKKAALELKLFSVNGEAQALNFRGNEEEGVAFFPTEYKWLGNSELLLYSQKEKSYKFGVLRLQ